MKYFSKDLTLEQVKIQYRQLCKEFHPDLHSADEKDYWTKLMQEINAEYALASMNARRNEEPAKRAKFGKAEPTPAEYTDMAAVDERIRAAIEKIIIYAALEIEICGLWVWVGGTTKRGLTVENDTALDTMMTAGFKWASKKSKWYFAGVPASSFGKWDMDKIRTNYGSTKVSRDDKKTQQRQQVAA